MSESTSVQNRAAQLSAAKRSLLQKRLQGKSGKTPIAAGIPRRSDDSLLSPSFAQQPVWFLNKIEPESAVYNMAQGFRLKGELRVNILEQSLSEIVRRHEALRTTFSEIDGKPVQVISPQPALNLQVVDLQKLPETEREQRAQLIVTEEARRPFDLATGPLFRAVLVRLGEQEYILALTMHHIITDGWSFYGVFRRELEALYAALSESQPSPLPEPPLQYADFSNWQRQRLQGEVLEGQLAYWKKQLAGEIPVLQLPTDRPRPAVQTYFGANKYFDLPAGLAEKLRSLSQQHEATMFMTLLAAFEALLCRYTRQADFAVGCMIANRIRGELEGLLGYFANTLVLRADLSEDPQFVKLLGNVREAAMGAFTHQDTPLDKLLEVLNPPRVPSYSSLFQVMFAFQSFPMPALRLPGLTLTPVPIDTGGSWFDLTLFMHEHEKGLSGKIEYNTDLFDAETIERMVLHFGRLLEGVVANPDQRISEIPLLTEAERHRVLLEWNQTETPFSSGLCVHQLVARQAALTPDRVAVSMGSQSLSYRRMEELSDAVAVRLSELGVRTDSCVAICLPRSLELPVAVLGTLKAGGAYVPIDPAYPKGRIEFMLEDCGAQVLISQREIQESIGLNSASVLNLESIFDLPDNPQGFTPIDNPSPSQLAYVIYTSGSTGRPKGVAMEHRPLVNLIEWQNRISAQLPQSARTLQFSAFSFDASFQEMFSTWSSGGHLVLVSEEIRRNPVALWDYIVEHSINRLFMPFVALQQLAEAAASRESIPECLREVITAGEQLLITPQVAQLFQRLPRCTLYNFYGPTETHGVTSLKMEGDPLKWPALPSIGRPIDNARIYILDDARNPVPVGVTGEIWIGGHVLARGYLKRPEMTTERFIPDPFNGSDNARIYRTGDLGRFRPDGNIEFFGRADDQIKIRGFRVELAEVETVLRENTDMRDCAVKTWKYQGGNRLVAYMVPPAGGTFDEGRVRKTIRSLMPDYMCPSFYVVVERLPLTPSGKVDRRALPAPGRMRPELEDVFVAPRTQTEKMVAEIWAEVLGFERIGIHDDFFDLGGNSLILTQVSSRLNRRVNMQLPLRGLFKARTVEALAEVVDTFLWAAQGRPEVGSSQKEKGDREIVEL